MVANAFVDDAMNKLSDASVKVYLLIVRKTRGWTKESDALSLRQLESLSKKSRPTVIRCLNELEEVGLIKKHHLSKYGNVYSPVDNYDLGDWVKFPTEKMLVKSFILFKKEVVKNFNHFGYGIKLDQKAVEFILKTGGQDSLLVKNFNHLEIVDNFSKWSNFFTTSNGKWSNILTTGGKEFLPQVVKNFNQQSNTIKSNYQNKKNTWLSFENLKNQIESTGLSINTDEIFNAVWFSRELEQFEHFNAEKNHSDQTMNYFFADRLIEAYLKYERQAAKNSTGHFPKTPAGESTENTKPEFLVFSSAKQMFMFANKLARLPEVSSKFSTPGESYEDLASRIAAKLSDPNERQNWKYYLDEVGFKPKAKEAAA